MKKLQAYELKEFLDKQIEIEKEILKERKNNINNNYLLAKLDFTAIENMEDYINTLNEISKEVEELQNRIIQRNRKKQV